MPKGQASRAGRRAQLSFDEIVIPDRMYFRIAEVSELTAVKAHVLRYWETEFPTLKPEKNKVGQRLYRKQDVETLIEIKRLLYEKGFTIEGARKQLAGSSADHSGGGTEPATPRRSHPAPAIEGQQLRAIKRELQGILTILSPKC